MTASWKRTPFGYVSADEEFILERGGLMTHGCNAWLIWRKSEAPDPEEYTPVRRRSEVTGEPGRDEWYLDTGLEGGWLSEAKLIVAAMRDARDAACTCGAAGTYVAHLSWCAGEPEVAR